MQVEWVWKWMVYLQLYIAISNRAHDAKCWFSRGWNEIAYFQPYFNCESWWLTHLIHNFRDDVSLEASVSFRDVLPSRLATFDEGSIWWWNMMQPREMVVKWYDIGCITVYGVWKCMAYIMLGHIEVNLLDSRYKKSVFVGGFYKESSKKRTLWNSLRCGLATTNLKISWTLFGGTPILGNPARWCRLVMFVGL